jgi:hypothetical protein
VHCKYDMFWALPTILGVPNPYPPPVETIESIRAQKAAAKLKVSPAQEPKSPTYLLPFVHSRVSCFPARPGSC